METAQIASYCISLMIGLIMGLIGGGGALLLPTFVYLLKKDETIGSAYTLLLVGVTAAFGAAPRIKNKQVDFPTVFNLGIPILVGTLIVRNGIHYLPDVFFSIGSFDVSKRLFVLLLFATILLLSFASMLGLIGKNLKPRPDFRAENPFGYYSLLIGGGLAIGVISAFIGAGGGVMIVPLLVVVMGFDMRTVIGCSLTIMALKSPISFFLADAVHLRDQIEWGFLAIFAFIMITGVVVGTALSRRIDGEKLKSGFAWLILLMAVFIFAKEIGFPDP